MMRQLFILQHWDDLDKSIQNTLRERQGRTKFKIPYGKASLRDATANANKIKDSHPQGALA
ncbi:hypothetical protein H6G49_16820 [Nostoc sp. PCC 7120 = FACHB-418]|uniref:Uncharacterized protein n=1 Tax=Trichormus variabilis NIES-23 TaxID=1973479 RepID=A0A1Z4KNG0_ANAVA|nr:MULTISPECIES: hypothetical protein [Nostocaceae]MBD2264953.1 hypothetical protein [Anabaena sp. FACHB-709]MBD2274263.1 hypothetical protein [Nostoc sp. PCC 7120 = FACHB-418]MBD2350644.1 hypothetical protein [Trichormus variabilis FACHB-171]BAY70489.1 hypothetical protein NIES23_32930 [Trichormus variabilis NIES-23]